MKTIHECICTSLESMGLEKQKELSNCTVYRVSNNTPLAANYYVGIGGSFRSGSNRAESHVINARFKQAMIDKGRAILTARTQRGIGKDL